jgi:WD40 repeat protein
MRAITSAEATASLPHAELVLQLGHSDSIRSVLFTPDGRRLISGAWDNTVRIWLREGGEQSATARWALLRTLLPGEVVNAVALSPDGGLLAAAGSGITDRARHGRVFLWDARTLEPLRPLDGHTDQVRSLCFSPDGATLASGSMEGSGILWDVRTWTPRCSLRCEPAAFDAASFSCDSALVATPQGSHTVLVWDARTGELCRQLDLGDRPGCVDAVAFSPREALLAVGAGSGAVSLWDTGTWELCAKLQGCRSRVMAVAFSPGGETVAAADIDSVLCVWDVQRGKQRWRRCIHPRGERRDVDNAAHGEALSFSPDGRVLAVGTGLFEDSIRFFNAHAGDRGTVLRGLSDPVTRVFFSPDSHTLAGSGIPDGTLRFWDTATGQLTRTVKRGRDEVWLIGYSPDGAEVLTSGGRRGVQRWDACTDASLGALTDRRLGVCAAVYSPDGAMVAVGGWVRSNEEYSGRLQLRDARTGRWLRSLRGHVNEVIALAFSPDGAVLASGAGVWCKSGEVRLWEVSTGRCLHVLTGHPNQVESVAFSPDGRLLASAGVGPVGEDAPVYTSDVRLWDVATGQLVRALPDLEDVGSPIAFSPDGTLLATRSAGTDVKLWDPESGECLRSLAGHTELILDLAFSPDGHRLATASLDGTVKLWDPRSGALLVTMVILPPNHPRDVSTEWITFTPAGQYVSSDGAAPFIRWRVSDDLLPADRFEAVHRSETAVGRVLRG